VTEKTEGGRQLVCESVIRAREQEYYRRIYLKLLRSDGLKQSFCFWWFMVFGVGAGWEAFNAQWTGVLMHGIVMCGLAFLYMLASSNIRATFDMGISLDDNDVC
jgi:hypothetical protein